MGHDCGGQRSSPAPPPHPPAPGQFFELDVYHSDGTPLTADQLFVQLEKIWNSSLQTNKEPVGILTSNHRNSWAKAYNTLIKGARGGGGARPTSQALPSPGPGSRFSLSPLSSEQVFSAQLRKQLGQMCSPYVVRSKWDESLSPWLRSPPLPSQSP